MGLTPERLAWLTDTDPALRWQVERDLLHLPEEVWRAARARVATEGFGARLLALQDADGQWAGGAYFPASDDGPPVYSDAPPGQPDEPGEPGEPDDGPPEQPWTATTWSLNALREWGLDASVLGDTAARLDAHSHWEYDDLPYWGGEVDCCINGYTLANGTWLGAEVTGLVQWFAEHQLADGGWNCAWVEGATVSSFHSTMNALEGLLYRDKHGEEPQVRQMRHAGQEYLLQRGLMRGLRSGELVAPWVTMFGYPFRWIFNVLRAADYFRRAASLDGVAPDPRLAEAIEQIRAKRQPDGTWMQDLRLPGAVWFEVDVPPGQPSPWLTLYGTRVLEWWDGTDRA